MRRRCWHFWLVGLALAMRALVPVGFMPAGATGDAGVGIAGFVICTSAGLVHADRLPDGAGRGGPANATPDICPLGAPPPALSPSPVQLGAPRWLIDAVAGSVGVAARPESAPRHGWQARAPPMASRA